ncbi:MAG: hypothetical protein H6Q00_2521 [Holophagaceae bacterium]|nr:hypothetical protein [Holophagaceae bacterium]
MEDSILKEATKEQMVADINAALEGAFEQIHALHGAGSTLANKVEIMEVLYALNDRFLDIVRPCLDGVALQCRKGCAHCCEFRVEALPVEALRIAAHLGRQGDEPLAEWTRSLEAQASYARGRSEKDYQRKCTFMDQEGACRIYEVRPFKCRVYHSLDEESCRVHRKNYKIGLLGQLESMVVQSVVELFGQAGLSMVPGELSQSVLKALKDPGAEAVWFARGNPFR